MESLVDVILPLPIRNKFTYSFERNIFTNICVGMRVVVPFGKNKIFTGIIYKIYNYKPLSYEVKSIIMLLDKKPIISALNFDFWKWVSNYYICSLGDILKASFPSTLLLEGETQISKKEAKNEILKKITDDQFLIYEALEKGPLSISDLISIVQKKSVMPVIEEMIKINLIELNQNIKEKYIPKLSRYICLNKEYENRIKQKELFKSLKKSPKQLKLIDFLIKNQNRLNGYIKLKDLRKKVDFSSSVLKVLLEKKVLKEKILKEDRIIFYSKHKNSQVLLTENQKIAFNKILEELKFKNTVLFEGVTSSGKTEIYVKLIELEIKKGNQVLYLLPEISLASQIMKRLILYFGNRVKVYHSRYSLNERTEVWKNVLDNEESASIIIGARSSVFLPFRKLGLIIIDEEHESSYKQFDPNPRYNARDCGIYLGSIIKAKVVLGSATPSIESSHNARKGKYGWVKLKERYGGIDLPEIKTINLKESYEKKKMDGIFSFTLINEINKTLKNKHQVILFQNRRGYSPILECLSCGYIPQCVQCDVSLTYHQVSNQLRCHYCGYNRLKPNQCDSCGMFSLESKGMGTQQIHEQVIKLFPGIKVERMDYDNTRGKYDFDKIIDSFSDNNIQILVGTQMLIKGLDFKNVQLVGVLNADHLINFPDFRSYERTYQMLCQVSGRAGRYEKKGKVFLQTFQNENEIFKFIKDYDYESMYENQKIERKKFKYPPFVKLIKITFKNRNFQLVNESSQWFYNVLYQNYKGTILGPVFPYISKIRNLFQKQLLIKIDSNFNQIQTKKIVKKVESSFRTISRFRSTKLSFDVDPY